MMCSFGNLLQCMYVCNKVHVCRRPRVYVHMYVCINCMCRDSLIVVYYQY